MQKWCLHQIGKTSAEIGAIFSARASTPIGVRLHQHKNTIADLVQDTRFALICTFALNYKKEVIWSDI